ncbi:hypothetical protein OHA37_24620 [Streptomyces sp. NBC_00335]|uniref:hypothetical protein n=1 Tax=unclassified Streptomyces TaxID=2593676 RepID=UPI00224DFE88|nr:MULTISPECIES: hypothetical protein [unclassified Streptomyces]MCX5407039.1 hypothetical protein [Streptomyces sp. NBC_00086]
MRRGLVGRAVGHAGAWTLATGAAVTLSWWGVHSVMSGTAYDPPLAVPLATQPLSSSTHRATQPEPLPSPTPSPSPSPSPSASASTAPASPSPSARSSPPPTPRPQRQGAASENVKAYSVSGGRVVFDLGTTSADLVSATPLAGWRMQVWKQPSWIRVTFTRDGREVSVFCTWHDHPPLVEIVDP